MIRELQQLPEPQKPWMRPDGRPSDALYLYMRSLDEAVRQLIAQANADAIVLEDFELRITDLETP